MTELMGWMGLYEKDGRINADLPAELSGDEIGRVRLVEFESDGHKARLELRRDELGNKGNTKDSGIHRYDFWNKARRGHPHPFGMTEALFTYDEDNGILVWEVMKDTGANPFIDPDDLEEHVDMADASADIREVEYASSLAPSGDHEQPNRTEAAIEPEFTVEDDAPDVEHEDAEPDTNEVDAESDAEGGTLDGWQKRFYMTDR